MFPTLHQAAHPNIKLTPRPKNTHFHTIFARLNAQKLNYSNLEFQFFSGRTHGERVRAGKGKGEGKRLEEGEGKGKGQGREG